MAYADVSWSYKSPLTVQQLNQMVDNSVWTSEHRIVGCEVLISATDTANIAGGRMELDGKWLTRDGVTTTGLALTAAEASAWYSNSASEPASASAWYIVAYNDTGSSFVTKYRIAPPEYSDTSSGTATGPKMYDKSGSTWMRYIGYAVNNTAAELLITYQIGDEVYYGSWQNVFSGAGVNAGDFIDVDLSQYVPAFGPMPVNVSHFNSNANEGRLRTNGIAAAGETGIYYYRFGNAAVQHDSFVKINTDTGQVIERWESDDDVISVFVCGYSLEHIRR